MVERVIDRIKLKMVSAVGEADDEIYVWLEEEPCIAMLQHGLIL